MKKMGLIGRIVMIFLLIAAAAVMAGCASAVPKVYVPESELPKTKFVAIQVATYKEFNLDKEKKEFAFNGLVDAEYGKIFKETFARELESKGFVIIPALSKNNDDFLVIEVSFAEKPPLIPFTNGLLAQTTIVKNKKMEVWRLDSLLYTDPPIIPASWVVRTKFAPALSEKIAEVFGKK